MSHEPRIRREKPNRTPKFLTVKQASELTPNMIRVTLTGPDLATISAGCEGANCKLLIPAPGQSKADFIEQVTNGPRPTVRTYTIRHARPSAAEVDIDFALHSPEGPATRWARQAQPGDVLGLMGPGPVKVDHYTADFYIVAADMAALPVAAATLEAMPRDARGIAIFEVTTPEDRYPIDLPKGVEAHWLIHADPHQPSTAQEELLRAIPWPEGKIQTCIAGESGTIAHLKKFIAVEKALPKADTYISGYWKIGLVEDEHQRTKRAEMA